MARLGCLELSGDQVTDLVRRYMDGEVAEGAFLGYDSYTTNDDPNVLVDGDLLAPGLLGVPVDGQTFLRLREARERLQEALSALPDDMSLAEAPDDVLTALGTPFAVIDDGLVTGARGVILSKILHRKKPRLIPVYDQFVWAVYSCRLGHDPKRHWSEFFTALASEMRTDLQQAPGLWGRWEPEVTALRALDMAVWQLGRNLAASAWET